MPLHTRPAYPSASPQVCFPQARTGAYPPSYYTPTSHGQQRPGPYYQPPSSRKHQPRLATIKDLPNELLQYIFQTIQEDPDREKSLARPCELKLNFPYNVAFTCKAWNAVAFMTSELWTDIRVYIGYNGRLTSLKSLQTQLRLAFSHEQRVNVHVKMGRDEAVDDPVVRYGSSNDFPPPAVIQQVFHMLAKYEDRIDTMYVNNSSTVPPGYYEGGWGIVNMPCGNFSWAADPRTINPFGKLGSLIIDGTTFLDACSVKNFWATCRVRMLGIRHLQIQDDSFGMRKLVWHLSTLPKLTSLEFEDVHIDDMYDADANGPTMTDASGRDLLREVGTLAFIKINEQFVRSLTENARSLMFADHHFYECDGMRLDQPLESQQQSLFLNDMHGATFRRLVRHFNGEMLYIDRCRGFDDQFLAQMTDWVQRNPRKFGSLTTLSVDRCHGFTFAAFSRFMQALSSQPGRTKPILLHCNDVPHLQLEERAWLNQITNELSWD